MGFPSPIFQAYIEDLSNDGYIMLRDVSIAVEYPFEKISQVLEGLLRKAGSATLTSR